MKANLLLNSLAAGAQLLLLIAAPAPARPQNPPHQIAQTSKASGSSQDLYADAFARLTYSDEQKQAISKIRQDIALRKAAVLKDGKLNDDVKDDMLNGYMRIEYNLIYKELTPEQKRLVSSRMRALRASEQAAQKMQAPQR